MASVGRAARDTSGLTPLAAGLSAIRPMLASVVVFSIGINVLMLWGEAMAKGFACPIWMTYNQASELGAQVRKGEHGSLVVFASSFQRTEADA